MGRDVQLLLYTYPIVDHPVLRLENLVTYFFNTTLVSALLGHYLPFTIKTVFDTNYRRFYCTVLTILSEYKAVLLPVLHYTLADSQTDVNDQQSNRRIKEETNKIPETKRK